MWENFLQIQKNANWKKVDKIFKKFWTNFTLSLKIFLIKFVKFWNKLLKGWIFVNSFMKHNIKKIIKTEEITDN